MECAINYNLRLYPQLTITADVTLVQGLYSIEKPLNLNTCPEKSLHLHKALKRPRIVTKVLEFLYISQNCLMRSRNVSFIFINTSHLASDNQKSRENSCLSYSLNSH